MPAIRLPARALCDLELLATGGFSPLAGFMGQADYARVLAEGRLAGGTLFPIPDAAGGYRCPGGVGSGSSPL